MKISTNIYNYKPFGNEIAVLSRELENNDSVELQAIELGDRISKGHTFCLANFEGGRKVSNCINTKMVAIDIDYDATLQDTLERCKELSLTPSVTYYSFSANISEGKHNHRVIFELDRYIDARDFKLIQLGLMLLFPLCDKACKDMSRLWLPGNSVKVTDGLNKTSHILYLIKKYFCDSTSTNKTSDVKVFAQSASVEIINGTLAIGDDLESVRWTTDIEGAKSLTKSTTRYGIQYKKGELVSRKIERELLKIDINELGVLFPKLGEWLEGKYWATYNELLMIASNLSFIVGGMKRFNKVIDDNPKYYDNFVHNRDYYKIQAHNFVNSYVEPKPMSFVGVFEEYNEYGKNFITAYRGKQKKYTRLRTGEKKYMKIEEAEKMLKEMISKSITSEDKVVVIKVPTGLGKTENIVKEIDYDAIGKKVVIAVPNHKLRKEVRERFRAANNWVATTVERPIHILPEEAREQVLSMYNVGAVDKAGALFTRLVKKHKLSNSEEYTEYKWCLDQAMSKSSNVVLTTHALALTPSLKVMGAKVLIIDEDCINTLFYPSEIKIEDIRLLLETVKTFKKTEEIQEWLKKTIDEVDRERYLQQKAIEDKDGASFVGKVNPLEPIGFITDSLVRKIVTLVEKGAVRFRSPVLDIFRTNSPQFWNLCMKFGNGDVVASDSIKLVMRPKLPGVDKIIILSATASRVVWRKVDDNIKFLELPSSVENVGTVIQYLDFNTSKRKLTEENQKEIECHLYQRGINLFISYKQEKYFSGDNGLDKVATFGSLDGLDCLTGKDIAVIGTPNLTESDYNLQAFALSGNLGTFMTYRLVRHNEWRFPLYTFGEGFYQDYHLHCINSALIQAIGRARVKRTNATVTVYSHVPVEDVDEYYYGGLLI